jgi:hypothetical protein
LLGSLPIEGYSPTIGTSMSASSGSPAIIERPWRGLPKACPPETSARAYLLLLSTLHQRQRCYAARHHYILGPVNAMADDASRMWHLSDDALLTHIDLHYPQRTYWIVLSLPSALNSSRICALCRQQPTNAAALSAHRQRQPLGRSERPSVPA